MQDSAVPQASSYYYWEPPDRSIRVFLSLRLIDSFQPWMTGAYREEREVGGILLGTVEESEFEPPVVRIETAEAVAITHQRGPTYSLSEKEKDHLARHIARARSNTGLQAVGLVRSHVRRGLYLDTSDVAVFQRYFPGVASLFLVAQVGPEPVDPVAGLFFWEGDSIHQQAPYTRFPFDSQALVAAGQTVSTTADVFEPAPAPLDEPAYATGNAAKEQTSSRAVAKWSWPQITLPRGRILVTASGVAVALLLTAASWYLTPSVRSASSGTAPHTAASRSNLDLGLSVITEQQTLRVAWHRESPLLKEANAGTLWIQDGGMRTSMELDRTQLAKGSAVYNPTSPDVAFMLEVRNGRLSSRETVGDFVDGSPQTRAATPGGQAETADRSGQNGHVDALAPAPKRTRHRRHRRTTRTTDGEPAQAVPPPAPDGIAIPPVSNPN